MKCTDVRAALPLLIYGESSPQDAALREHLAACPACRREHEALASVRRLLVDAAVPHVTVDLPQLHRALAERQMQRVRRWRRIAVALGGIAAVLLLGSLALFSRSNLRNNPSPESVEVAATASPGKGGDGAVRLPPGGEHSERESLKRHGLALDVVDAQVIVVAAALDSTPAPAKRPGDLPENLIRFQVKRILKGNLLNQVITTRTPTAASEFIGKDWIILLSPDYMARKYQYACHVNVDLEPTVKAILFKDKK